ncbi:hypothetical protein EDB89DRAFT_305603 [Lactarius sanguifluus]|nr:hypothetical protein EDB89DRAFT_305603 [Lactarius sanguifluus]
MAQIDAPRFHRVIMILHRFYCLRIHQLFLFIDRTENFRPSRVRVNLCDGHIDIHLVAGHPSLRVLRPHFSFSTPLEWSNTQVAYLTLVLSRMSAVCSHVEYQYLAIYDCENRPGSSWHDYIDRTGWLAFFRQLTTVETLYIHGALATQVVRALEDVPGEMVTEVLPSLHSLWVDTGFFEPVNLKPAEQFITLRRLYGRPVTIRDGYYRDESVEGL